MNDWRSIVHETVCCVHFNCLCALVAPIALLCVCCAALHRNTLVTLNQFRGCAIAVATANTLSFHRFVHFWFHSDKLSARTNFSRFYCTLVQNNSKADDSSSSNELFNSFHRCHFNRLLWHIQRKIIEYAPKMQKREFKRNDSVYFLFSFCFDCKWNTNGYFLLLQAKMSELIWLAPLRSANISSRCF